MVRCFSSSSLYAANGIWYDALAHLAQLRRTNGVNPQ
ncbi:DUF928 domain-containing protein, partial [Chroococcidiopsis cubana]